MVGMLFYLESLPPLLCLKNSYSSLKSRLNVFLTATIQTHLLSPIPDPSSGPVLVAWIIIHPPPEPLPLVPLSHEFQRNSSSTHSSLGCSLL